MCGLAGYNGLLGQEEKLKMVIGLGAGIDSRGGHAAGYISANKHSVKFCKKLGKFMKAKQRFINTAAEGDACMMHARFATCGNKENVEEAHPYAIRRHNKIVLWGCHNGTLPSAWESAKKNDRKIAVDSQEIFELLADKDYEGIRELRGYGVITWIEPEHRDRINVVKLSNSGDIEIVKLEEGGIVWASTYYILKEAVKLAGLTIKGSFKDIEVGRVYQIAADGLYKTDLDGLKVGDAWRTPTYTSGHWNKTSHSFDYDDDDGEYAWWGKSHTNDTSNTTKTDTTITTAAKTTTHSYGHGNYDPPWEGKVERTGGIIEWYKNKRLHREDGPARITPEGVEEWWFNGKRHRLGGPAIKRKDGSQEWYEDGFHHRIDAAAIISSDGKEEEWWYKGQKHRKDGPAITKSNGDKEWWVDGKQHRIDGAAVEYANSDYRWYYHGQLHREDGPAMFFHSQKGNSLPAYEGYYIMGQFFKTKVEHEAALKIFHEEQKKAKQDIKALQDLENTLASKMDRELDRELNAPSRETKAEQDEIMEKDNAFMREMHLFLDKWDKEDDDKSSINDSNFLLKGLQ